MNLLIVRYMYYMNEGLLKNLFVWGDGEGAPGKVTGVKYMYVHTPGTKLSYLHVHACTGKCI